MSKLLLGFMASCLAPAMIVAGCGAPATESSARGAGGNQSVLAVGAAQAPSPAQVEPAKGSARDLRIVLGTQQVIGRILTPRALKGQAPVLMIASENAPVDPPADGPGSHGSAGLDYRAAYERAWSQFRAQDYPRAIEAMVSAISNWQPRSKSATAHQEMVFMMARAGIPVERAARAFRELAPGDTAAHFKWLFQLYQGYDMSGYRSLATEALDAFRALRDETTPAQHRISIQLRYVNSYIAINRPGLAATWLIKGHRALAACGAPCQHLDSSITAQLKQFATHFHSLYKTTQDERLYSAARRVYQYHASLQRDDAGAIQANLDVLEASRAGMVPDSGIHDKSLMDWATKARNNTIRACYESVLLREPTASGGLSLTLDIDDSGRVTDVNTDPLAGPDGIPAIAGCVQTRTRSWKFPSRSQPGMTTVIRTYEFTPRSRL